MHVGLVRLCQHLPPQTSVREFASRGRASHHPSASSDVWQLTVESATSDATSPSRRMLTAPGRMRNSGSEDTAAGGPADARLSAGGSHLC